MNKPRNLKIDGKNGKRRYIISTIDAFYVVNKIKIKNIYFYDIINKINIKITLSKSQAGNNG